MLKDAEKNYQGSYVSNCIKVMHIVKEKQKDFALEALSQIDASVNGIAGDAAAFKNIRNRLFTSLTHEDESGPEASEEGLKDPIKAKEDALNEKVVKLSQKTKNKLYLYMFHLFESLISNVTSLVGKSVNSVF